ncbi:MAG: tetratricopeptide repeat protein [Imperialibacter sp.]|uniref:tetratricopeptide repeat-containing sensor histidine kinase n=1 Tax=Imperialibacter sp. TaxID=2038411 RepID=UPI0032EF56A5
MKKDLDDTLRVRVYNSISAYRHLSNFDMAMSYAEQALELSLKLAYEKGEAKAYQNKAIAYWAHGRYDSALFYHSKAMDIFERNNMEAEYGEAYNKIGLVYYYTADYPRAIEYLNKSEQAFRTSKDTINLSRILNNMGLIFDSRGDYLQSEQYFVEAMKLDLSFRNIYEQSSKRYDQEPGGEASFVKRRLLHKRLHELKTVDQGLPSLTLVSKLFEIANLYDLLTENEKAREYFLKSEIIYKELGESLLLADCYRKLAKVSSDLGDMNEARAYLLKSHQIYLENGYLIQLDYTFSDLAKIARSSGDFDKAIEYLNASVSLNDSLGHRLSLIRLNIELSSIYLDANNEAMAIKKADDAYELASQLEIKKLKRDAAHLLFEAHSRSGQFEKALFFLEESTRLNQIINDALAHREIAKLQIEYETEEKQKEIDQLSRISSLDTSVLGLQRQLITLLSGGLLTILILLVFVSNRLGKIRSLKSNVEDQKNQIGEQNKRLEKKAREREILIGEIHHRVKNNLQIISSLLRLQQRGIEDVNARKAIFEGQNRVQSMSLLHQRLYQQGNHESVELKQYAEDIFDHLLRVHHLGESEVDRVNFCEEIELDVDTAVTFGLIVNEIFSNIFKHAYQSGKKLIVKCEGARVSNEVLIKISDNGPGFDLGFVRSQAHFGLNLMKMLVAELGGTVQFSNGAGGGAEVEIKFRMA